MPVINKKIALDKGGPVLMKSGWLLYFVWQICVVITVLTSHVGVAKV